MDCKWELQRYLPETSTIWFQSTDRLLGTDEWGNPNDNSAQWGKKYDEKSFNLFLFANNDLSEWAIMKKSSIFRETTSGAE